MTLAARLSVRYSVAAVLLSLLALAYLFPLIANWASDHEAFVMVQSSDQIPNSLLPVSLLRERDLYLNEYAERFDEPYFWVEVRGNLVSVYPVATALLATPIYALPVWLGIVSEPEQAYAAARVAAALLTLVAIGIWWRTATLVVPLTTATVLALALGLGTAMWTTVSQGLWQHTGAIPFACAALWFLLRSQENPRLLPWAGFCLAMAAVTRYPTVVFLAVVGLYVLLRHREQALAFALLSLPPLAGLSFYNAVVFGLPDTIGYVGWAVPFMGAGAGGAWYPGEGVAGILVSPAHGLLIFSPFLLPAVLESVRALRDPRAIWFPIALACWALVGLMGSWWAWHGYAYGNRMLADSLPLWGLLLARASGRFTSWGWGIFAVAAAFAVVVHALGLGDYGVARPDTSSPYPADWLTNLPDSTIPLYAREAVQWLRGVFP